MTKQALPRRRFRCRLDELGPLNDMVKAMFITNRAEFSRLSPEFGAVAYTDEWAEKQAAFELLVPTGVRRATDKEVTREMTALAKSLREPLNWLDIRLARAAKKNELAVAAADFGISPVRKKISTSDMEGLDGALNRLLQVLQLPANLAALARQGHTAADTAAFVDARDRIMAFNTEQNSNLNAALELTEENIKAGNALWEFVKETLDTGGLMYKVSQPKKARTFQMQTLMKRVRNEGAGPEKE